jgi:exopolyphosphatase / guanosine-5'-triphosphate,3'-diphosphate pyrophosphatase
MPVAAIDIGTNTTRLIVAEVSGSSLQELERRTTITRLGEGVDRSGSLSEAGIGRVFETLAGYLEIADELHADRALALATSAVRDASNGGDFLSEVESRFGFEVRLLSGNEEALLAFRGATIGRTLTQSVLVVDIGGGSTELVVGDASGPSFHISLDIGAVRLSERYLHSDPPTPTELEHCRTIVRELLVDRIPAAVLREPRGAIGNAGTITTIAALDQRLPAYDRDRVHGYSISRHAVYEQLARLAALPLSERRLVPALEPERAPVIVAGAIVCRELLDAFALEAIEASELDILDGAALLAAEGES